MEILGGKHTIWREDIFVLICVDTIWMGNKICVAARLLLGLMKDAGEGLYLPNVNEYRDEINCILEAHLFFLQLKKKHTVSRSYVHHGCLKLGVMGFICFIRI